MDILFGLIYHAFTLFTLQPEWLQNVYEYLLEKLMLERFTTSQRQYLASRIKPFMLQKEILY